MHELKDEYTIVIVTHNMQQAARVADMTAFFGLEVLPDEVATASSWSTTRPRRSSPACGQADGGLRDGTVRMRVTLQQDLDTLQAGLLEEGELVLRALRGALNALREADGELADEVIAFDDEVDRRYLAVEAGHRGTARAADTRGRRPSARARHAAHEPPSRANGGLLRHDRKADKARRRAQAGAADGAGVRGDGLTCRGDDQGRARRVRQPDVDEATSLVELDELIDRANRRVVKQVLAFGSGADGMGRPHAARLALPRADRRPRRRHRRAGCLPGDRGVPRVHGRLASRRPRLSYAAALAAARSHWVSSSWSGRAKRVVRLVADLDHHDGVSRTPSSQLSIADATSSEP